MFWALALLRVDLWNQVSISPPNRSKSKAGLDVGDVGSDRYQHALGYLVEEAALLGDEHTATQAGAQQAHGYVLYFFTRRAVKLLEG